MKKIFFAVATVSIATASFAQNVGIGTITPKAALNAAAGATVLFGADITGPGNKVIWHPTLGAFRAGKAYGDEFDYANVGMYSVAFGQMNIASGDFSFAVGSNNTASGEAATAMGTNAIASGKYAAASGKDATAVGIASTAIGFHASAYGDFSMAAGSYSTTYGAYAMSIGSNVVATGDYSTAMGRNSNTNNHINSFCIGGSLTQTSNSVDNQMMMRFDNYTFWVSSSNYAYLLPASNGWAYTSDINKKENFQELNGDSVLKKISGIPFYSWNFKAADTKQYRHYGVMAQHFYNAFGKDDYGDIGNDTTVSPLDLLGVAYSGIKELEKRTEILQKQNDRMTEEIASFAMMKAEMEKLKAALEAIKQKIE